MTPAAFQELARKHQGVAGVSIVNPTVDTETPNIDPTGQPIKAKAPNPTPTYKYVFNDGTEIEAITQPNGDIDVSDPGTAMKPAGGADQQRAPTTFPDGSLRERDPKTGEWVILATKPQGPVQNQAPELVTLPDGSKATWNPATSKWDIAFPAKAPGGTEPALNLPAARAGQKTDLNLVEQQANAFIAATNADQSLDPATRRARVATYIATVVKPAVDQATKEVAEESDRLRRRQEEADRRAEEAARRSDSTAERQTRVAEEASALGRAKFGYEAGQDAVQSAMGLLKYQTNPRYLDEMTRAINTIGSGGGPVSFSPEAFRLDLPDVNALAAQGAARAQALYESQRGLPLAPRPDAVGMPGAALPVAGAGPGAIGSSSGATAGLAQVPFTPRPEMAAAAAPVSAAAAATPGVPAGTPSPLGPGWEWLNGPAGVPRSVY